MKCKSELQRHAIPPTLFDPSFVCIHGSTGTTAYIHTHTHTTAPAPKKKGRKKKKGIAAKWDAMAARTEAEQKRNIFSKDYDANFTKKTALKRGDKGYGRAPEGSLSEARAKRAKAWVKEQMDMLLGVITRSGAPDKDRDGRTGIKFGPLFYIYQVRIRIVVAVSRCVGGGWCIAICICVTVNFFGCRCCCWITVAFHMSRVLLYSFSQLTNVPACACRALLPHNATQDISDTLVGMIRKCRKAKLLDFEGDMLFQHSHGHVMITLTAKGEKRVVNRNLRELMPRSKPAHEDD